MSSFNQNSTLKTVGILQALEEDYVHMSLLFFVVVRLVYPTLVFNNQNSCLAKAFANYFPMSNFWLTRRDQTVKDGV